MDQSGFGSLTFTSAMTKGTTCTIRYNGSLEDHAMDIIRRRLDNFKRVAGNYTVGPHGLVVRLPIADYLHIHGGVDPIIRTFVEDIFDAIQEAALRSPRVVAESVPDKRLQYANPGGRNGRRDRRARAR